MATEKQIAMLISLMQEAHPARFFDHMDQSQAGIGAVMRILSQAEGPVTAGKIAEDMDVSTARVAVLLKKMEAKGLIVKGRDPLDARVTMVYLSQQGVQTEAAIKEQIARRIGELIDKIGMERMLEFVSISKEIRDCFPKPEDEIQNFLV